MLDVGHTICIYGPESKTRTALQESLTALWPLKVVACCDDRDELLAGMAEHSPRAVLMILDSNPADTLDFVRLLAIDWPEVTVIGLSMQKDPEFIASAIEAGCSQVMPLPLGEQSLVHSFENMGIGLVPVGARGRRICVVGPSGGSGTTTIACNLAVEMARISEQNIAIADLHIGFGSVASQFAISSKHSIDKLCHPSQRADAERIRQVATELPCGVSILSAPENLARPPRLGVQALRHLLLTLSKLYHAIIIDTPRMPTAAAWTAVDQAHAVMLVMQMTTSCLKKGRRLYEQLLERNIPRGRILLVINRYHPDYASATIEEVEADFGHEIFATIPSDYELVQACTDASHPLMVDAPDSPVRLALCNMASRLLGVETDVLPPLASVPPHDERHPGFLEWLLRP